MMKCKTASVKFVVPLKLALAALVGACSGQVDGSGNHDDRPDDDNAMPGDMVIAPGLDPENDNLQCDGRDVGLTPLRRLTNLEFDATVRDLFVGVDVGAPSRDFGFPADAFAGNFSKDATRQEIVRALAEGYLEASQKLGTLAAQNARKLFDCDLATNGESSCITKVLDGFALRAFRRPLAEDERTRLTDFFTETRKSDEPADALAALVQRILMSPQFLYRVELGGGNEDIVALDDWQVATRLAYLVTGTMPDPELFAAAKDGRLADPEQIAAHTNRLLDTDHARLIARRFFREWLDFGFVSGITRDDSLYPGFDANVAAAMLEQAERLGESLFFDSRDVFTDLMRSPKVFTDERLANFLGLPSAGATFAEIEGDPERDLGFLTNAAVMTVSSHGDERKKSIFRGLWVRNRLLCQELPAPPADIPALPSFNPDMSSREQLQVHLTGPGCMGCHRLIDPVGFGFSHYDGAGRWTDKDGKHEVDASGELLDAGDTSGEFYGVPGLAERLEGSQTVRSCVTRELFRFAAGRNESQSDACSLRDLRQKFVTTGSFRDALLALVTTDAFRFRKLAE